MDRTIILMHLRAITYASARAHVALSNWDTDTYLDELAKIDQLVADIHAENEINQNIFKNHTDDESD
jgi:hypothetical protein